MAVHRAADLPLHRDRASRSLCGGGSGAPHARRDRLFADLHLTGACRLLDTVASLCRTDRLDALRARAPWWLRPVAMRFCYVFLALLVNLPGSSVIGGGGGILFTAGLSRLFQPVQTVVTILCAVAPVPLAETVETYEIDILDGPGGAVLRTLSSDVPSVTYTTDQIAADFGSTPAQLSVSLCQISEAVGRGLPRTTTLEITP